MGPVESLAASDPFGTLNALHHDTAVLGDPLGHDCTVPGGALSFPAAVDLALCRNPPDSIRLGCGAPAGCGVGWSESAWLPTLTLNGGQSRYYGQHADVNGNIVNTPQNTTDATANLAWTIYDFGARGARIKSAHRLLDAAAASVSSVAQQSVRAVVQGYYGAVAGDAGSTHFLRVNIMRRVGWTCPGSKRTARRFTVARFGLLVHFPSAIFSGVDDIS